jgi:hypothetical protein
MKLDKLKEIERYDKLNKVINGYIREIERIDPSDKSDIAFRKRVLQDFAVYYLENEIKKRSG